jgi:hypothetical protein
VFVREQSPTGIWTSPQIPQLGPTSCKDIDIASQTGVRPLVRMKCKRHPVSFLCNHISSDNPLMSDFIVSRYGIPPLSLIMIIIHLLGQPHAGWLAALETAPEGGTARDRMSCSTPGSRRCLTPSAYVPWWPLPNYLG